MRHWWPLWAPRRESARPRALVRDRPRAAARQLVVVQRWSTGTERVPGHRHGRPREAARPGRATARLRPACGHVRPARAWTPRKSRCTAPDGWSGFRVGCTSSRCASCPRRPARPWSASRASAALHDRLHLGGVALRRRLVLPADRPPQPDRCRPSRRSSSRPPSPSGACALKPSCAPSRPSSTPSSRRASTCCASPTSHGYFRRLNPEWERTLGYPLESTRGRRFLDLVHPDDVEATLAAVDRLAQGQSETRFVNRYRTADGVVPLAGVARVPPRRADLRRRARPDRADRGGAGAARERDSLSPHRGQHGRRHLAHGPRQRAFHLRQPVGRAAARLHAGGGPGAAGGGRPHPRVVPAGHGGPPADGSPRSRRRGRA